MVAEAAATPERFRARMCDIPAMLDLGERFHAMSSWRDRPFDCETMRQVFVRLIQNPEMVLLYNGTGILGGFLSPIYFGGGLLAQEVFWFADKNGRELLDEFEAWARDLGADGVLMVNLALDERTDRVMDAMYRRRGYGLRERHYWKEL